MCRTMADIRAVQPDMFDRAGIKCRIGYSAHNISNVHLTSHPEITVVELHHLHLLNAPFDTVPALKTGCRSDISNYSKTHKAARESRNISKQ